VSLTHQLEALPDSLQARLSERGFSREQLLKWASDMKRDRDERNRLVGAVKPVPEALLTVQPLPGDARHDALARTGAAAVAQGQLAVCVLAGGMATRMGGVVKALVEVAPGVSFLDLRRAECEQLAAAHGAGVPLWLMTSEPTDAPIREALAEARAEEQLATFEQLVSLRLTPEGALWLSDAGEPSVYATGHGDLPDALLASGLLHGFVARGGRYLWISNLDNLGASVDLALLGDHIEAGEALTVEVVDKDPGDRGGGPVMYEGRPIIAEHFRLPIDFDADSVPVFNTNTFIVDAGALVAMDLAWTYVEVHKQVAGGVAVQFERLLGEMTMALSPRFARVSRQDPHSRFLPVKSHGDLEHAQPGIARIARARGLL